MKYNVMDKTAGNEKRKRRGGSVQGGRIRREGRVKGGRRRGRKGWRV